MGVRRGLGVALALAVTAGACASDAVPSADPTRPAAPSVSGAHHPLLADARTFALALGAGDLDDAAEREAFDQADLVVVDGPSTSADALDALHQRGAVVLAYLNVGAIEPGRPWYPDARDNGWLLDHWDDWDEWYLDVTQPEVQDFLVDEAARELALGFDGIFLDNVDMVDTHPEQAEAMVDLVADLDTTVGPDRVLFAQNGDPVELGIVDHLDGWNREDVSGTYDFDTDTYRATSRKERTAAVEALRTLHARGVFVTATDYLEADRGPAADAAVEVACGAGAVPFIADIDLTRFPDPPLRCP